jgi:hypothetical protein
MTVSVFTSPFFVTSSMMPEQLVCMRHGTLQEWTFYCGAWSAVEGDRVLKKIDQLLTTFLFNDRESFQIHSFFGDHALLLN